MSIAIELTETARDQTPLDRVYAAVDDAYGLLPKWLHPRKAS